MNRRTLLKSLATLPFVGGLFGGKEKETEKNLFSIEEGETLDVWLEVSDADEFVGPLAAMRRAEGFDKWFGREVFRILNKVSNL